MRQCLRRRKSSQREEADDTEDRDWDLVLADFLATGASYRKLSERHALPLRTLQRRAAAEHWQDRLRELREREAAGDPPPGPAGQNPQPAETVSPEELALETRQERRLRLMDTADTALEKIQRSLQSLGTEEVFALTSLIRAMKDMRDLLGLNKDALDLVEQQARIAKLHNETSPPAPSQGGVVLLPLIEGELRPPEE